MNIREQAKQWLKKNHPSDISNALRVSKYHLGCDFWFFTFPTSYFEPEKLGNLNILLQYQNEHEKFYFLKVPFSFFKAKQKKFDIRPTGDKFDLHISAKKRNWLICIRSDNVNFSKYEQ